MPSQCTLYAMRTQYRDRYMTCLWRFDAKTCSVLRKEETQINFLENNLNSNRSDLIGLGVNQVQFKGISHRMKKCQGVLNQSKEKVRLFLEKGLRHKF